MSNTAKLKHKKVETIHLIDDDTVFQFLAKKMLEDTDLVNKVKIFSNGLEAIEFLKANYNQPNNIPEIILLDLSMPVMDGWEYIEEYLKICRKLKKNITLYIVSSSIDPKDIEKAKSISAVEDYLIKPVTREKLKKILDNL